MYEDESERLTVELTRGQAEALWVVGEVGADVARQGAEGVLAVSLDYDQAAEGLDELKGVIGEDRCAELCA
jgi:hypothetical protein